MHDLSEFMDLLCGRFDNREQFEQRQAAGDTSFPFARHVNTICNQKISGLPADFPGLFLLEEIVQVARKIGTFETSILPYEDCCTVFTPRHPRLRPMPGEVEAAEQALDVGAMVKTAVDGIERVQVNL